MGVAQVTGSCPRLRELGACLRAHRALIRPDDVGLPASGRRRTPGLRREEVASLAGVGLSWYTWLEQGRVTASAQVLDSVGRVLRLDGAGRHHLRRLSTPSTPPPAPPVDLRPLLATWADSPAAVLDHRLGPVAVNRAWASAFGDPDDLDPDRRTAVWQVAAAGAPGSLLRAVASRFRMAADLYPEDPGIRRAAAVLRADFPELAPVWTCRGVGEFGQPVVELGGRCRRAHLLHPADHPDSAVLVLGQE
jgi:hypothetical protein